MSLRGVKGTSRLQRRSFDEIGGARLGAGHADAWTCARWRKLGQRNSHRADNNATVERTASANSSADGVHSLSTVLGNGASAYHKPCPYRFDAAE